MIHPTRPTPNLFLLKQLPNTPKQALKPVSMRIKSNKEKTDVEHNVRPHERSVPPPIVVRNICTMQIRIRDAVSTKLAVLCRSGVIQRSHRLVRERTRVLSARHATRRLENVDFSRRAANWRAVGASRHHGRDKPRKWRDVVREMPELDESGEGLDDTVEGEDEGVEENRHHSSCLGVRRNHRNGLRESGVVELVEHEHEPNEEASHRRNGSVAVPADGKVPADEADGRDDQIEGDFDKNVCDDEGGPMVHFGVALADFVEVADDKEAGLEEHYEDKTEEENHEDGEGLVLEALD